jgi:hypothetical protein
MDGRGLVKGKLRPSGQRIKDGDAVMQDTNTMRGRAALVIQQTDEQITMGPQGVSYAAEQNAMRPFLFFQIEKDLPKLVTILATHIQHHARNKRGIK